MNGAAERIGQTVWRKTAPMLKYSGLDLKFWPEAVRHAMYLYLRSPHSRIKTTPYAAFHGQEPDCGHIRTFGSVIYYNNPKKGKLRDQVQRRLLVGYEGNTICRILKSDGRIARGAAIRTVEKLLWDRTQEVVVRREQIKDYPTHLPITIPQSALPPKRKRTENDDWFLGDIDEPQTIEQHVTKNRQSPICTELRQLSLEQVTTKDNSLQRSSHYSSAQPRNPHGRFAPPTVKTAGISYSSSTIAVAVRLNHYSYPRQLSGMTNHHHVTPITHGP
jgi:hypothetical protein